MVEQRNGERKSKRATERDKDSSPTSLTLSFLNGKNEKVKKAVSVSAVKQCIA